MNNSAPVIKNPLQQEQGLLYGFFFAEDQPAQSIDLDWSSRWLKNRETEIGGHFIWLHFNLNHQSTLRWLKDHLDLSEQFYELLNEEGSSTRIEQDEQHLLALVNDIRYDGFSIDPGDISTLWASADQHILITLRRKPLRTVDALRRSVQLHETFRSPADLLAQIFRHQADTLVQIIRTLSSDVDRIEDSILKGSYNHKRNQLGNMRRTLVRLQRLLAPEPSALFRLINRPPLWLNEKDVDELHQATEEISTVIRDMNGLQERIKLLQEEIASLIIEQTNRSLFVLTGLTVIALPVNMIAGLFGMNVGGIPFAESNHGFWLIVWLVVTISGFIAWIGLNRTKDLS